MHLFFLYKTYFNDFSEKCRNYEEKCIFPKWIRFPLHERGVSVEKGKRREGKRDDGGAENGRFQAPLTQTMEDIQIKIQAMAGPMGRLYLTSVTVT